MGDAEQRDMAAARALDLELIRRFMVVPVKQPNAVTWTAVGGARRVLLAP